MKRRFSPVSVLTAGWPSARNQLVIMLTCLLAGWIGAVRPAAAQAAGCDYFAPGLSWSATPPDRNLPTDILVFEAESSTAPITSGALWALYYGLPGASLLIDSYVDEFFASPDGRRVTTNSFLAGIHGLGSGNYTITVTQLTNGACLIGTYIVQASPTVQIDDAPSDAIPFQAATFSASGTRDPLALNPALTFTWDFGDGSNTVDGASVSHAYDSEGSYTVSVTSFDGTFYSSPETHTINVSNDADIDDDLVLNSEDNCVFLANSTQVDSDGDLIGNRCDADFDNNDFVNFADLSIFQLHFLTSWPDGDFDESGTVNFADLSIFGDLMLLPPGPSAFRAPGSVSIFQPDNPVNAPFSLNWQAASGWVEVYEIERRRVRTNGVPFEWNPVGTSHSTSFTFYSHPCGEHFDYRVRATNTNGTNEGNGPWGYLYEVEVCGPSM